MPRWSSRRERSAASCAAVYGGGSPRLRPWPRRSGTITRCRAERASRTGSNISPLINTPCTSRRGGPDPRSVKKRSSASRILFQAAEVLGDRVEPGGFALERLGDAGDLSRHDLVLPLLDRFSDTRQRLDAVAGIEARRVQQVLEPVAVQEAGRIEE